MSKIKFYYDPKTLSYRRIETSFWVRARNFIIFILSAILAGFLFVVATEGIFESPKEKALRRDNEFLKLKMELINKDLDDLSLVLSEMQKRDDNIYRIIFEAEPIDKEIRKVGMAGANRYKDLEGFASTELVKSSVKKLDKLKKQTYIQSKSFDEVVALAKNKNKLLSSIPAIQPVANQDLTRLASGFGMRIHPVYKVRKLHSGIDFSAPTGTPIYATGDGKVIPDNGLGGSGYGNFVIISHGFGYHTLYAHMSKINVKIGQQVKRGDIIGFVGSTGTSTAPHLHYEVIKNGEKINPINFFYNDLSPEEYEQMIILSSQENQSFD